MDVPIPEDLPGYDAWKLAIPPEPQDHQRSDVQQEIEFWQKRLPEGEILSGHDHNNPEPEEEPDDAKDPEEETPPTRPGTDLAGRGQGP